MSKVAVITGATKGIGRACAIQFAQEGFDLAICSRNEEDLEAFKLMLKRDYQTEVYTQKVDVSKKDELKSFSENVLNWNSNIHVLINNAGVFTPGKISEEEDGTLEHLMSTNTYSAYYLTRFLLEAIKKNKTGYIFNICSTASIMPYINGGSYCISKHAMLGFSRVLREELKEEGIRVSAVMPGATYTSSWEGVGLPKERFIKAMDIAQTIWSAYSLSGGAVIEEILIRPQLGDI